MVPHTSASDADSSNGIGDYPDEMEPRCLTLTFGDSPVKSIVAGNRLRSDLGMMAP